MSFPPSWIGINFHRSSHPGIFLVKKTFPFLVNLSELYTLIEEEITLGTMCHQTCLYQMSIHKLEQSFSSHLKQKRMFATWSCWPSVELVLRLQQLCPRSPGEGILQQKEQTRMGLDLRCWRFHLPDWKIVWLWAHRHVEPPNVWSGACSSGARENQVFCSSASSFKQTMTILVNAAFLCYKILSTKKSS